MDEQRIFVDGRGLKDAVGVPTPHHFKVAVDDAFVGEDAADLLIAVDHDASAIGGFKRRRRSRE